MKGTSHSGILLNSFFPFGRMYLKRNIWWLLCSHLLPLGMSSWIRSRNPWRSREQCLDGVRQLSGERCGYTKQKTCSQWNRRHLPLRLQGPVLNCLRHNRETVWGLSVLGRQVKKSINYFIVLTALFHLISSGYLGVPLAYYQDGLNNRLRYISFLIPFFYCFDST